MVRTRPAILLGSLLSLLPACGGGGKKSDSTPLPDNTPPSIVVPPSVTGAPPSFQHTLTTSQTESLVFTATDAEGDPLTWQVSVDGAAAAAAGISFPSPFAGNTLTLTIGTAVAPAAVTLTLLVEDQRGAAAAIDLRIVRSGPPTITGISPGSAFTTRGQAVQITGTALRLGGAALTSVSIGGLPATGVTAVSDTEVRCTTPTSAAIGNAVASVSTQFGTAALPSTAFRFHSFPPALFTNDVRLDAGNASDLQLARERDTLHAVWREGTTVVHRVSTDRGASWSPPLPLSGAETATEPQVLAVGSDVLVAWIGDGTSVLVRRSTDGGATFEAVQRLDPLSPVTPASRVRLAKDDDFLVAAWIAGDTGVGAGQVVAATSADLGVAWTAPNTVAAGGQNQRNHEVAAAQGVAWVAFEDDRLGAGARGAYVARTINLGTSWQTAQRVNSPGSLAGSVRLLASATRVYVAWVQSGSLLMATSADAGATYGSTLVTLHPSAFGTASEPALAGDSTQLTAAFVVNGTSIRSARFTTIGATVLNATLETVATESAEPRVATSGNYVFVAWREGNVGGGTARVQFAVSTDNASTFGNATLFGDGLASQAAPRLGIDGANVWFGWLDSRVVGTGVYANRTEF